MSDIKAVWDPKIMFAGKIVQLVFQDMEKWDKKITYERAERAPWVRVIIQNSDWKICLSREHRTELNSGEWWYDYRLPWGKVFDTLVEYNECRVSWWDLTIASEQAAIVEAKEEAWIVANDAKFLYTSGCWTTMRRDLYYFLITDFSIGKQELHGMEHIEVNWYTVKEVKRMCLKWEIQEDRSVAVLLRYLHDTTT